MLEWIAYFVDEPVNRSENVVGTACFSRIQYVLATEAYIVGLHRSTEETILQLASVNTWS